MTASKTSEKVFHRNQTPDLCITNSYKVIIESLNASDLVESDLVHIDNIC